MTMILIIAIIAAVIFAVFCVLCFLAMRKNQMETQENSTRITNIESQLGSIGRQITQATNRLEKKISEVICDSVPETNPNEIQPKIQHQQKGDYQKTKNVKDEISFDELEIEEIDDEVEIENILSQFSGAPVAKTTPETQVAPETQGASAVQVATPTLTPAKHFQGYDIGRSGKKYTVLELMELIEE